MQSFRIELSETVDGSKISQSVNRQWTLEDGRSGAKNGTFARHYTENSGFCTLFQRAVIHSTIELGQIFFFSGRDLDFSCPNQVRDRKYLNRSTGDNPAKTSSQRAKIPPNRKRYFFTFFAQAAIISTIEQGQIFSYYLAFLH